MEKLRHFKGVVHDGVPARFVFTSVSFIAIMLTWGLRAIPNLAIVAMVNFTAIPRAPSSSQVQLNPRDICEETDEMPMVKMGSLFLDNQTSGTNNEVPSEDGEFIWDESIQQLILSSFYWGYLVLQIPGGRWAEMYGGRRLLSACLFASGLFTLLAPVAARAGYVAFIATRVGMGVAQAVMYPALTVLIARWAPPHELSRMNAVIKTGSMFGVFVINPSAGWLIANYGWSSVFYVFGVIAVVWGVIVEILIFDSPDTHSRISIKEKEYILESLGSHNIGTKDEMKKRKVPWKAILTSVPFWAATLSSAMLSWGFMMINTMMPTYMKVMMGFDIQTNGLLNGVPYLGRVLFGIGLSCLADYIIAKKWTSRTFTRKACSFLPGIFRVVALFVMPQLVCDATSTVALFIAIMVMAGASWSTTGPALIEMSPNFAGTVYGIFNMGFTIVAIIAPVVSASFIKGNQTFETWSKVFNLSAGLALAGILVFFVFGSAEEQPWNRYGQDGDELDKKETPKDSKKDDQPNSQSECNGTGAQTLTTSVV